MSEAAVCGWTALRSLLIACAALPVCALLARFLETRGKGSRRFAWGLLLLPFLTPELLPGYAYANFSLSLIHQPFWNERFADLLLWLRAIPAGTALAVFAPSSPLTDAAIHCRRLALARQNWWTRVSSLGRDQLRGPGRWTAPAMGLMFLVSIQQFETASLLGTTAWTVQLFKEQAGGLPLGTSLRMAALPVCCELLMLLPLSLILVRATSERSAEQRQPRRMSRGMAAACWGFLAVATTLSTLIPFAILGSDLSAGIRSLASNSTNLRILVREIVPGVIFSALACGIAAAVLRLATDQSRGVVSPLRRGLLALLVLPGLAGSLVVGLVLRALFQQPGFNHLYGTAIPWIVALVVISLPRLALLQILLFARREEGALHASTLLAQSPQAAQRGAAWELAWNLRTSGVYWTTALAAFWAYFDVAASTLLAPTRLTPAVVRLYNLMHYGRNASLSTLTTLAVLAPVVLCVLVTFLWRRVGRWLPV